MEVSGGIDRGAFILNIKLIEIKLNFYIHSNCVHERTESLCTERERKLKKKSYLLLDWKELMWRELGLRKEVS